MVKKCMVMVWVFLVVGCTSGVETLPPTTTVLPTTTATSTPPATRTAIAQTHEVTERDIYAVLLQHSHFRDQVVALLQEPADFPDTMWSFSNSNLSSDEQYSHLLNWLPTLQRETWDDFMQLRSAPSVLTDILPSEVPHTIIAPDDMPDSRLIEAWEVFWEKHPGSFSIYSVSRIGLNPDQNQALVYVETQCWGKCGDASVFLLEKQDGQWEVVGFDILVIA